MAASATSQQGQGNRSASNEQSLSHDLPKPVDDLVKYAQTYAKEQPEMAMLWCLGIGFVLGWKLKPW